MAFDPTDSQYLDPSLETTHRRPAIVTWNRLEPRPRALDFTGALRAEIRDPLWFIARQLQLGEFLGEDAGTAVLARVAYRSTELTRWSAQGSAAQTLDADVPLEVSAERTSIELDLAARAELGQFFLHFLEPIGVLPETVDFLRRRFPFEDPGEPKPGEAHFFSDPEGWQFSALAALGGIDGGALIAFLDEGNDASKMHLENESIDPNDIASVDEGIMELLALRRRVYGAPPTGTSTWQSKNLRYRLRTSAPEPAGARTVLDADDYRGGHLDWYAFDVGTADTNHNGTDSRAAVAIDRLRTYLPTELRYPGMPAHRWWQFEEGQAHFGGLTTDRTDLSRMFLSEFLLAYANDWMFLPYSLRYGSLAQIRGLAVINTFGERVLIRNAIDVNAPTPKRWSMYTLTNKAGGAPVPRLFMPPVVVKLQEHIVEEVELIRDEAANFVWAVESTLPGRVAGARNGHDAARAEAKLRNELDPPTAPLITAPDAHIQYLAGNEIAANWFPLVPVRKVGAVRAIELRRARMPAVAGAQPPGTYVPKTSLLTQLTNLEESEVPRGGSVVTASWQRTRGTDGTPHLWKGFTRRAGHGARSAGLRFDAIQYRDRE